jgi:glycosyltransferase involved in cell wall biosynthesis
MKIAYYSSGTSAYDTFFLAKLGLEDEVRLLTFTDDLGSGKGGTTLPFPIGRLPARDGIRRYLALPLKALLLRHFLKTLGPDVLVGCKMQYALSAVLSGVKPTAVFLWGSDTLVLPKTLPFRIMVSYVLSKADLVVVDSEAQVASCRKLGCNPSKIVCIPWVDVNELMPKGTGESRSALRERFGWAPGDTVVTCTRNHYHVYNVETVLRSVPLVLARTPGVRFLLVGSGPITPKLKRMVDSMGVQDAVRFAGYLPHSDLLALLRNSDIYVSSSLSDGTSASLIEAMASPLPCVVSDIPGNRPWIVHGTNGYVFPPNDQDLLSEYVSQMVGDEGLRNRLAKAAQETVKEKADWRKNSPHLRSALADLNARH